MIKAMSEKDGLEGLIWAQIGLMVSFNWVSRNNIRKHPDTLKQWEKGKLDARKMAIKWLREDLNRV